MNVELEFRGEVQTLRVEPGDLVVLSCKSEVDEKVYELLKQTVKSKFPDNEVLVLTGGLSIAVVSLESVSASERRAA